jgi:hypothetical protein
MAACHPSMLVVLLEAVLSKLSILLKDHHHQLGSRVNLIRDELESGFIFSAIKKR